jgi:hypothetical protein
MREDSSTKNQLYLGLQPGHRPGTREVRYLVKRGNAPLLGPHCMDHIEATSTRYNNNSNFRQNYLRTTHRTDRGDTSEFGIARQIALRN